MGRLDSKVQQEQQLVALMAQRNGSLLLTLALVAAAAYCLLPAQESFVAPRVGVTQGRDVEVSMAAGPRELDSGGAPPQNSNQLAGPRGLNLLFVGLLGGSAAIGLLALFFYGAYSGTGSSI